ncbi:MAG: hypothetical protein SGJ17_11850 [Hyphomicrobiales bacterium]|nr:hypothetical protein [Hyphomicrobiales bacterium]
MSTKTLPYSEMGAEAQARIAPALERIFFLSSATKIFRDEGQRMLHYDRWLGRYLRSFPGNCYIRVDTAGEVLAYLAGCPDSAAAASLFADIDYYPRFWRQYADFPAHFHVNAAPEHRDEGHGAALVEAYAAHCRVAAVPGMHAVTSAGSPAAAFFGKCGMRRVTATEWQGRCLELLGRKP